MTGSTAVVPAADVLAQVISTVAGPEARPRDDQIRAVAGDCPSSVSQASGTDTWYGDLSGYSTIREAVDRAIG